MNLKFLNPQIEYHIEFNYAKAKYVPIFCGCYVLSNYNNDILYIGKTNNLQRRFKQHLEDFEKVSLTRDGIAYWFSHRRCVDEYELSRLERGWLNHYELGESSLPLLNKIHAGC
ncbi:GIY-YIG nuclease family protein [Candidatus Parcubacteria bacterium]|nr:GIY-YIG nuclease family protein [Candidatus Parcubacteria bacterium]